MKSLIVLISLMFVGCATISKSLHISTEEDWQATRAENKEWRRACLQDIKNSSLDPKGARNAVKETNDNFDVLDQYVDWAQSRYSTQMDTYMAQAPAGRCVNMVKYKSDMNFRYVHEGPN